MIVGANAHNLHGIDVAIPTRGVTVICGVSGSGKSTLLFDVLTPTLESGRAIGCERVTGADRQEIVAAQNQPLTSSGLSTPVTYLGVLDDIRSLFAASPQAKESGLTKKHFSFNTSGGRCEACAGQGRNKVALDFLGSAWTTCIECDGKRFLPAVLRCKVHDRSITDLLEMTIDDATVFFAEYPKIARRLDGARRLGIGHLSLGRSITELSGGETQRLRLARDLGAPDTQPQRPRIYLFDEPTTGLHFCDVEQLIDVLSLLVDEGNTVVVIEHNLEVIRRADWVIELGPDGGPGGGRVVATGTPERVAQHRESVTGEFLRSVL